MPEPIDSDFLTGHFSTIASKYNRLRITDAAPVELIARYLQDLNSVTAADVGCGTGRYMIELGERLRKRLFAYFVDSCEEMLECVRLDPNLSKIKDFRVVRARAEQLPFADDSLDCVLTFNAVHHFSVGKFFCEAARVLRPAGLLFVYTRLREQNEQSLWGRYFPLFAQKETRLLSEQELRDALAGAHILRTRKFIHFRFCRDATLDCLRQRIRSRHYSTFCSYEPDELECAIVDFEANLRRQFGSCELVRWVDENTMVVAEKRPGGNIL